MTSYLACMKKVRGVNRDECRQLAKSYLACRMDKYAAVSYGSGVAEADFCAGI